MDRIGGIFCIIACFLIYDAVKGEPSAAPAPVAQNDFPGRVVSVPTDTIAVYKAVNIQSDTDNVLVVSERHGKTGAVYVVREIDCSAGNYRHIIEDFSLKSLQSRIIADDFRAMDQYMYKLVKGSVSYYIAKDACKHEGKSLINYQI